MDVYFPKVLQCLFKPARYKVLHGGRGGSKSWGIARALLLLGKMTTDEFRQCGLKFEAPLRILCAREFMKSLDDSVHKLLSDQISELGLNDFYTVTNTKIIGANGSEFIFKGLRHNINNLKSTEAIDIVWIEEARDISKLSLDKLIPTIRRPNSEIWLSFNPELEYDEVYQRFILNTPQNAIIQKCNWYDNPWFPDVLREEMEECKKRSYDDYLHIWEGHCKVSLDGAIYAHELRKATEENRITKVPYNRAFPVHTFFDLGRADNTSIWFMQQIGFNFYFIDYEEDNSKDINHYIQLLQKKQYVYGRDYLPHDAAHETIHHKLSIEQQMKQAGRSVKIVPKISVHNGINAARTLFPNCYFDQENCADGLQCLRNYVYDIKNDGLTRSSDPLHNWASHGADAFRYFAVGYKEERRQAMQPKRANSNYRILK